MVPDTVPRFRDSVPELIGPQGPTVLSTLRRLRTVGGIGPEPTVYRAVEETLGDFWVVAADLDRAEFAYMAGGPNGMPATYEEHWDAIAELRSRIINYFHAGYALLDAIALYAASTTPATSWRMFARELEEADADPDLRTLARILTIRLYLPRHVVAAHRKGWAVPAILAGSGSASLSRRPHLPPMSPDAQLVSQVSEAFLSLEIEEPTDLPGAMQHAGEQIARKAAACGPSIWKLYHALINIYGLQTLPVSRISPSLLALTERVVLGGHSGANSGESSP